jgi:hypothetical protein
LKERERELPLEVNYNLITSKVNVILFVKHHDINIHACQKSLHCHTCTTLLRSCLSYQKWACLPYKYAKLIINMLHAIHKVLMAPEMGRPT